jgi:two-component system KDP operon response regulator KdpE
MLRLNDIQIDQESGAVTRQGEPVQLTRKERQLMRELAASPGRTVSADSMLTNVWGPSYRREVQYLRVWVSRLRSKLEQDPASPSLIKTVQGIGYLLDAGTERIAARP